MASQERGLSLPVPGVGERLKKIVDALKNRGHHGIMQASVIAPEKPKTDVPSDLTQEELKQLIPPSPGSSKEPPKNKKPWIQRAIGNLGVRIGLGVLAAGGAGYAAREVISDNIPALSRPAETVAPFDNSFLDVKPQTLVFGKNARYATPEEIQSFINSPLPEMKKKENIKTPADLPVVAILPSFDLQKAEGVKVSRSGPIVQAGPLEGQKVPFFLHFLIENQGTPVGVFMPAGIKVDAVEIFLKEPVKTNNGVNFSMLYEKFNLGNGKYVILEIYTGNDMGNPNATANDVIKNAPTIIPNNNDINDIIKGTGTKLSIKDKPALFTTISTNADIVISTLYIDISNNANSSLPLPAPQTQNGNLLFSALP